jgi:hypothetical protein
MSFKQTWAFAATTLLACAAAAHEGHGAPPLHLHDAEMLGLAALAAVAATAVGATLWMRFFGRK